MRGTRRLVLLLTVMVTAILLASGAALAASIVGTDGPDTVAGTEGDDTLDGLGGDDTIEGLAGKDTVEGGDGADHLYGGNAAHDGSLSGADVLRGEIGNDYLEGSANGDRLNGGGGADTVVEGPDGDQALDTIFGGSGADLISAAGVPASTDDIDCGEGVDDVQADPLDAVSSNCENVQRFDPSGPGADPEPAPDGSTWFDCVVPRFGWNYCGGTFSVRDRQYAGAWLQFSGNKRVDFKLYDIRFGPDIEIGRTIYLSPGERDDSWRNTWGSAQTVYYQAASPAVVKVRAQGYYITHY